MKDYANDNKPKGKSGLTSDDTFDSNSKEYKLSTAVAGGVREESNRAIGDVLTTLEAAIPAGNQLDALKQLVKERIWSMVESNQHTIYYGFGIEPRQLRDSTYIQSVHDGTDSQEIFTESPAKE